MRVFGITIYYEKKTVYSDRKRFRITLSENRLVHGEVSTLILCIKSLINKSFNSKSGCFKHGFVNHFKTQSL